MAQPDLLKILVENKVISPAQAELVETDMQNTSMAAEDVLLARRWITSERLYELAPWLKADGERQRKSEHNPQEYRENLSAYRKLTNEILGEKRDE